MEEFKTITRPDGDYENYQVSNLGNILNVKKNRLMTPVNNNSGYKIKLQGNTFLIHRLVALAFLPNPNNYDVVTHLDNNLKNNNVNNLKWIDKKENLKNIPQEKRKETGLKIQEKLTKTKQNNTYMETEINKLISIKSKAKNIHQIFYVKDNKVLQLFALKNGFYDKGFLFNLCNPNLELLLYLTY